MKSKLLFVAFVLCSVSMAGAQEEGSSDVVEKWMGFYDQRAGGYEIALDDKEGSVLQLHPTPLLKYTNPVRNRDQHGSVYAWTLHGRPLVIGTVWSINHLTDETLRQVSHELHSLSEQAVVAKRPAMIATRRNPNRQVTDWHCQQPGIQFKTLQATGWGKEIAESRRLVQMRQIAKSFRAEVIERNSSQPSQLRLMPSPLLRYKSDEAGVVDGAIFAFVLGTDPELFLLLESFIDDKQEPKWRYAVARFTGRPLKLTHQGQLVWQCDQVNAARTTNAPYNLTFTVSLLPKSHVEKE